MILWIFVWYIIGLRILAAHYSCNSHEIPRMKFLISWDDDINCDDTMNWQQVPRIKTDRIKRACTLKYSYKVLLDAHLLFVCLLYKSGTRNPFAGNTTIYTTHYMPPTDLLCHLCHLVNKENICLSQHVSLLRAFVIFRNERFNIMKLRITKNLVTFKRWDKVKEKRFKCYRVYSKIRFKGRRGIKNPYIRGIT